jgi:hypothetical protein
MGFYSSGRRSGCHTLVVIDVTTVEVRIFRIILYRDGIFKLLRSLGIDSKESISPAYVACMARRYDCKPYSYPVPSRPILF